MASLERPALPPSDLVLAACRRLLRPLVRLLIRAGVTFPVLSDVLRGLYVEVAVTDLLTGPGARTDSRVSLMTGVHRKEIRRLRESPADAAAVPPAVTLSSQIIALWLTLPNHSDASGRPLPLPRGPVPGGGPCFDALVAMVTTDVRPRAVLDEWLSQGLIEIGPADRVRLLDAAYLPKGGGREQMFYFARNLRDHIEAAAANIATPGPAPFMERAVHYDRLTPAVARALEDLAREAAGKVLLDVNRAAAALVRTMPEDPAHTARVNFGLYVFREDSPEDKNEGNEARPP